MSAVTKINLWPCCFKCFSKFTKYQLYQINRLKLKHTCEVKISLKLCSHARTNSTFEVFILTSATVRKFQIVRFLEPCTHANLLYSNFSYVAIAAIVVISVAVISVSVLCCFIVNELFISLISAHWGIKGCTGAVPCLLCNILLFLYSSLYAPLLTVSLPFFQVKCQGSMWPANPSWWGEQWGKRPCCQSATPAVAPTSL